MRKSKGWQLILAFLALIGISWTSNQIKNKSMSQTTGKIPAGTWKIFLRKNLIQKELSITPQGDVYLDTVKVKGKIIHSSKHYFLFKDHYGYNLELFKNDDGHFVFYDEADDQLYDVEKV